MPTFELDYNINFKQVFAHVQEHYSGDMLYTPEGYLYIDVDNVANTIGYLTQDGTTLMCLHRGNRSWIDEHVLGWKNHDRSIFQRYWKNVENFMKALKYVMNNEIPKSDIRHGGFVLNMDRMLYNDLLKWKISRESKQDDES